MARVVPSSTPTTPATADAGPGDDDLNLRWRSAVQLETESLALPPFRARPLEEHARRPLLDYVEIPEDMPELENNPVFYLHLPELIEDEPDMSRAPENIMLFPRQWRFQQQEEEFTLRLTDYVDDLLIQVYADGTRLLTIIADHADFSMPFSGPSPSMRSLPRTRRRPQPTPRFC